jgi:hypothetical protein
MPLWNVTLRLPEGDRRTLLRELRGQADVVIRSVNERVVTVEVAGPDEARVRQDWTWAAVLSVLRVDAGWWGDWWDGQDREVLNSEYLLGPEGDGPDAGLLYAVPFHHFSVDSSGRCLTMADERDGHVIVTVTERRPRGAISTAGAGRRSTVTLGTVLGHRPVCDRRSGAARPHA